MEHRQICGPQDGRRGGWVGCAASGVGTGVGASGDAAAASVGAGQDAASGSVGAGAAVGCGAAVRRLHDEAVALAQRQRWCCSAHLLDGLRRCAGSDDDSDVVPLAKFRLQLRRAEQHGLRE
eukprot:360198-Chlamydomonas_euryale.AAC.2